ncbi:nuclear transport factor 2 family protein [Neorhizobium galegae]|uniref:SnoaL-like domain-containing protein n=1 Tax=Neorhizobium galegae bv. officinalis TaxID=323656 RepID=A0A0T7GLJ1_NEOGA|nr:Hypothetical protein NGAL_HAMBI1189_22800 [Neorhizobium galegae bv. officinalis]
MTDANTNAERYLAIWNETDAVRRKAMIAETWAEDGLYVDPLMRGEGHEGVDRLVEGVQAQFPGFRVSASRCSARPTVTTTICAFPGGSAPWTARR